MGGKAPKITITFDCDDQWPSLAEWHSNIVRKLVQHRQKTRLANHKGKHMRIRVTWETDGEDVDLPSTVEVPEDIHEDDVSEWLSERTGWLVSDWSQECEHEPEGHTVTYSGDSLICDVSCKKCGTSGSFQVNPSDINW